MSSVIATNVGDEWNLLGMALIYLAINKTARECVERKLFF